MTRTLAASLLFVFLSAGCIGFHVTSERVKHDYGPDTDLKVCFIAETGVTEEQVHELASDWSEELVPYKIRVKVAGYRSMDRPGFFSSSVMRYLYSQPLRAPCDRIVFLIGREAGDVAFEAAAVGVFFTVGLKFEVHGAVELATRTRGWVKAKYVELLQLIFSSPRSTMIHEGYHLLGCSHSFTLTECYGRIAKLKAALASPGREPDFFPSFGYDGKILFSRDAVNYAFGFLPE
ncbi:MAG: hypothetical protein HY042_03145 [Spirochaetia bacterium]|nr:hypothetical protein [Spirochaetia bacterium]